MDLFKFGGAFIALWTVGVLVAMWVLLPPFDLRTWFIAIGFTAAIIIAAAGCLVLLFHKDSLK